MSTEKKKAPEWLTSALENAIVRLVLVAVTALLAGGGVTGVAMAGGKDSARLDSLEVRAARGEARQDSAEAETRRIGERQMEMFSAQIEADSTLRAVLEERAANRRKAAQARAATEKLFDDLKGETP